MEMEKDEGMLQGALDCLLNSLNSLLKAHQATQQMLRLRAYEKWAFSDSLARAKKQVEATELVMKTINAKCREALGFHDKYSDLRIWERFVMRMLEQLNNFQGETSILQQYASNIFQRNRLQSMFQYLITQNLALIKELYEAIYQFQLRKTETFKKYQMRMCKPQEFRREFERQSDYDMLFVQIRMAEVFANLPVMNCAMSCVYDVMSDLEMQYHKSLQENVDNIAANMRGRNCEIQKTISKYKVDYDAFRKREPRAFFKSSLRYQNLNTCKTIRLSTLKAFYKTLPNGPVRNSIRINDISDDLLSRSMSPHKVERSENESKPKSFWHEQHQQQARTLTQNSSQRSPQLKSQNYIKSSGKINKTLPGSHYKKPQVHSRFMTNKIVNSNKVTRKYMSIPTAPNYVEVGTECPQKQPQTIRNNYISFQQRRRNKNHYQVNHVTAKKVAISYAPSFQQDTEEDFTFIITKAMPKGKHMPGKVFTMKDSTYSSVHSCQQASKKNQTPPLSIIISHNVNLHLKKKTIEMLKYGKYISHTRNHELVLM